MIDSYLPILRDRLADFPELSGVRLLAECRAAGYTGGITRLRDVVATLRGREAPAPVVRFETPPGHQAQVDFATVRFPWGTRYALLVVLGYSRLLWCRFYAQQTMPVLMHGIEAALAAFGGVPQELPCGGESLGRERGDSFRPHATKAPLGAEATPARFVAGVPRRRPGLPLTPTNHVP